MCTGAINIPQFDHVYNFRPNEISEWAVATGLRLTYFETIPHNYRNRQFLSSTEYLIIDL